MPINMAFTAKKLPVASDNVIYEHIIPRSVREKWMRRASVEPAALVTAASGDKHLNCREKRHSGKASDSSNENSVEIIDNSFGGSIVSQDIQEVPDSKSSEILISPEEELAVFTAFGVKLRHTSKDKANKRRFSTLYEGDVCQATKERTAGMKDAKPLHQQVVALENNDHLSSVSKKNGVQVRGNARKPRPMSMPVISQDFNLKAYSENAPSYKEKPKAYISPNAKVPWKRSLNSPVEKTFNLSSNQLQAMNDKKHLNDDNSDKKTNVQMKDQVLNQENNWSKVQSQSSADKVLRKRLVVEDEVTIDEVKESMHERSSWPSISEMCRSFEHLDKKDIDSKVYFEDKPDKRVAVQSDNTLDENNKPYVKEKESKAFIDSQFSDGNNQTLTQQKNLVNQHKGEKPPKEGFTEQSLKSSLPPNNSSLEKKSSDFCAANIVSENDSPLHDFGDMQKSENSIPIKETKYTPLLNIFKHEPTAPDQEPAEIVQKKTESKQDVDAKLKDEIVSDQFPSAHQIIAPSVLQNYERKINKMIIRTGEQREKQLKSKNSANDTPHKLSNSTVETRLTEDENVKQKQQQNHGADIPVTNLDDMMPRYSKSGLHIPITNLDELSEFVPKNEKSDKSNLGNADSKQDKEKPKALPNKKPGKYDADRRDLVAPKIYFEKPVTGLVSSLSGKGKKTDKKRMRVSFSTGELEKIHMYPSEVAAVQIYDEVHVSVNDISITDISSAITPDESPSDFQSYVPNSFVNLSDVLERERSVLIKSQPSESAAKSDETQTDAVQSNSGTETLFTEAATSGAIAMLF